MTSNVSFTMKRGTVKSSSPQTALVCSSFSLKKLIWIDKTRKTSLDGSYFRSVVFSEHAIPFTKDPFYDVDVQEATFLHDETRSIFSETTDGPVIHLTSMLVRTWVRSWRIKLKIWCNRSPLIAVFFLVSFKRRKSTQFFRTWVTTHQSSSSSCSWGAWRKHSLLNFVLIKLADQVLIRISFRNFF